MTHLSNPHFRVLRWVKFQRKSGSILLDNQQLGDLIDSKHIICFQTSCVEVQSDPMEWVIDGEYGGKYENTKIENINRAITLSVGR